MDTNIHHLGSDVNSEKTCFLHTGCGILTPNATSRKDKEQERATVDRRCKICLVTAGEDRLPAGTAEAIREFADFQAARCETPEELVSTFPDAEVLWMFVQRISLRR